MCIANHCCLVGLFYTTFKRLCLLRAFKTINTTSLDRFLLFGYVMRLNIVIFNCEIYLGLCGIYCHVLKSFNMIYTL